MKFKSHKDFAKAVEIVFLATQQVTVQMHASECLFFFQSSQSFPQRMMKKYTLYTAWLSERHHVKSLSLQS